MLCTSQHTLYRQVTYTIEVYKILPPLQSMYIKFHLLFDT